jgi:NAD(P)-dependent dehydrogenase (short-subunit alcohol dehydrogenase family)
VEAQRLLCKSAARQWATDRITVNCVLAPSAHFTKRPIDDEVALPAPVFGDQGDIRSDVGPIVAFLASDAAHFVTGATITADGSVPLHP